MQSGYCCVKIKDTEQVVIGDGECSLVPIRENVLRLSKKFTWQMMPLSALSEKRVVPHS